MYFSRIINDDGVCYYIKSIRPSYIFIEEDNSLNESKLETWKLCVGADKVLNNKDVVLFLTIVEDVEFEMIENG